MVYKPTDRERQRYIVYAGTDPVPTYVALFGAVGVAEAGLQRIGSHAIRATAGTVDRVKSAICLTPGCRSVRVTASYTKAAA